MKPIDRKTGLNVILFLLLGAQLLNTGCKKLVETDPPYTSLNAKNVFENPKTAAAVLTGIYTRMSYDNYYSFSGDGVATNLSLIAGLSSDELTLYDVNSGLLPFYTNSLLSTSSPNYWNDYYAYLFKLNSAIEGLESSDGLTEAVRNQLVGESLFLRGYCYFYLVNFYGDVPLVLTSDYEKNAHIARAPKAQVYDQIVKDLTAAAALLSPEFLDGNVTDATSDRVRPTKWAAEALLARVYLYKQDYNNANLQATQVISQSSRFHLTSLDSVFLANNREAIWQLQPVVRYTAANTGEGKLFILPSTGPSTNLDGYYPVYLSAPLKNSFEGGDKRKSSWTDSVKVGAATYSFAYKYKVSDLNPNGLVKEYLNMFRLGELYLVRAEARTWLGDFAGAKEDLNAIRHRAGLANTTAASDQNALLEAILKERRVELFTEGAHRWFDLKRWPGNTLSSIMTPACQAKGGSWSNNWALYPIPISEIAANPLLSQNAGYQ